MNKFANYLMAGLIAAIGLTGCDGDASFNRRMRGDYEEAMNKKNKLRMIREGRNAAKMAEQKSVINSSNVVVCADNTNQTYCSDSETNQSVNVVNTPKFVNQDLLARMEAKRKGTFRVVTGNSTNRLDVLIKDVIPYSIVVSYLGVNPPSPVNIPISFVNAIELEGGNPISLLCPRAENLWKGKIAEVTYISSIDGMVSGAEVISFGGYDKSKFHPNISPASRANGILINVNYPEGLGK